MGKFLRYLGADSEYVDGSVLSLSSYIEIIGHPSLMTKVLLEYLGVKSPEEHFVVGIRLQWFVVIKLITTTSLTPFFTAGFRSISDNKISIVIKIISSKLKSDISSRNGRFVRFFIRHHVLCCKSSRWVNSTSIV